MSKLLLLCFVLSFIQTTAQEEESGVYFMLDSIKAGRGPSHRNFVEIASVSILKGEEAVKFWGQDDVRQVLIMETKPFARARHWRLFKKINPQYDQYVPNAQDDQHIAYILNGRVLDKNYFKELSTVTARNISAVEIIDTAQMADKYSITDKKYGISLTTND